MKPKKELDNFQFLVHRMTGQSLKLGKYMTDQVANTLGHVRWLSFILISPWSGCHPQNLLPFLSAIYWHHISLLKNKENNIPLESSSCEAEKIKYIYCMYWFNLMWNLRQEIGFLQKQRKVSISRWSWKKIKMTFNVIIKESFPIGIVIVISYVLYSAFS